MFGARSRLAVLMALGALGVPAGAAAKSSPKMSGCASSVSILGLGSESAPPVELPGAPEAAVLDRFGVLSRPATAGDELPPLSFAGIQLEGELASYYPTYIRQVAAMANGTRWFIVPGFLHVTPVPPARCLSRSERRERPKLVEQERDQRTQTGYCLVQVGGADEGGRESECGLFSQAGQSLGVFSSGLLEQPVPELVPDEVAQVRVSYMHAPPLLLNVSEDVYVLSSPASVVAERDRLERRLQHLLPKSKHPSKAQVRKALKRLVKGVLEILVKTGPTKVQWLSRAGAVLLSVPRPRDFLSTPGGSGSGGLSGLLGASESAVR